jgi:hypothetical protein
MDGGFYFGKLEGSKQKKQDLNAITFELGRTAG